MRSLLLFELLAQLCVKDLGSLSNTFDYGDLLPAQ